MALKKVYIKNTLKNNLSKFIYVHTTKNFILKTFNNNHNHNNNDNDKKKIR